MKSKINYVILILLLSLNIFFIIIQLNSNISEAREEIILPKQSGGYSLSFIHVDDNWTDTTSFDWCYGQGTWKEPYVIENVTINCGGTGSGIFIQNSNDYYFIIKNCTIFNAGSTSIDAGIKFMNVSNGMIYNNTCSYNQNHGILLYTDCNNNTILENIANYNFDGGIYLEITCYENFIINNTVNNNAVGIMLTNTLPGICHHNEILNNTAKENGVGIWLSQSNYNTVSGNLLINNSKTTFGTAGNGIRITYYSYGGKSMHNIIKNNVIHYGRYGIFMYDGENNTISDNIITRNSIHGIYFRTDQAGFNCEYNYIANNTVNENGINGINFYYLCRYNTIINNTVNDNTEYGIYLGSTSDGNNITHNTLKRNLCGILLSSSDDNNVSENVLIDNGVCIFEQYCYSNIIEDNLCSGSTFQTPISIDAAATGYGANNWTWAVSQPWCSGSGTWEDPYIIENLIINGLGIADGIEIQNSDVYFIIQQCTILNAVFGIYLDTVNNSLLLDNNCSNNQEGIHLEYGNNNNIRSNLLNSNDNSGLYLYESNHSIVYDNTANGNYDGIYLDTDCSYNNITKNTASNNSDGFYIYYRCNNNTITGNIANNNINYGFYLEDCKNNQISNNIANYNDDYGILFEINSYNNLLLRNTFNYNEYGIYLSDASKNNSILENNVNFNYLGIHLEEYSDFNIISYNNISNNEYGIQLLLYCSNNTIKDNIIRNNLYIGVKLETGCADNKISSNLIEDHNEAGIKLVESVDFNNFTDNIIKNNTVGISISSGDNNLFYLNFFLKNGKHADDNGIDNKWNTTTIGNYWDNHTGPDITPQDGIVDSPYAFIGGSTGSIDYLPIAEDGSPLINIISPISDENIGNTAPSFNVKITDGYLDEMWYTIDDGLNNYTFTTNGTIDQSAWDDLPDGIVSLTFYALDLAGNIGFAEVSIIKDTQSPIIIVDFPNNDDEFGNTAPFFNITVIDANLDSIWYSLDGGTTSFAITTNATIDQAAWEELAEGSITITFYANDTLGNLSFEEVTIIKQIDENGIDPILITTITIVSIVGAVAIVGATYWYLKRNRKSE